MALASQVIVTQVQVSPLMAVRQSETDLKLEPDRIVVRVFQEQEAKLYI